jgi:hypothetical protein
MTRFAFDTAEVNLPHKRLAVRDVRLEAARTGGSAVDASTPFLQGDLQVGGELAIDCPPGGNPFRPGMQASLKLTAPSGAYSRLAVLFLENTAIVPASPKVRTYRWSFLVVARPSADPFGLFPALPAAGEISLDELLRQLGADRSALDTTATFTSEGGFRV